MPQMDLAYFEWFAAGRDHPSAEHERNSVQRSDRPSLSHRLFRRSMPCGGAPGRRRERNRLAVAADGRAR